MNFTIGETNIICTDLEKSLHFYRDVLGFAVLEQEGPSAVHLQCGDRLFLLLAVAPSPLPRTEYTAIPAVSVDLLVDNIETAAAHFKKHDVEFETELQPGGAYFFIRDPDGLVLEVIQPSKVGH